MGIGSIGLPQIGVVLLLLMLLFGAKRLPDVAKSMGQSIQLFKQEVTKDADELNTP